jgi:hypothetical protein
MTQRMKLELFPSYSQVRELKPLAGIQISHRLGLYLLDKGQAPFCSVLRMNRSKFQVSSGSLILLRIEDWMVYAQTKVSVGRVWFRMAFDTQLGTLVSWHRKPRIALRKAARAARVDIPKIMLPRFLEIGCYQFQSMIFGECPIRASFRESIRKYFQEQHKLLIPERTRTLSSFRESIEMYLRKRKISESKSRSTSPTLKVRTLKSRSDESLLSRGNHPQTDQKD